MKYGFVNNFKQALSSGISSSDTTMTLDGGGSDLDSASSDFVYALTLIELNGATEVDWEVVHVTGVSGNDLTIERGKDGTSARSWDADTAVELRLPAEILTKLLDYWGDDAGDDSLAISNDASATGEAAIAAGRNASASSQQAVAIGSGADAGGDYSIAFGSASEASGLQSLAAGSAAEATAERAAAFGDTARATGVRSAALGPWSYATGDESIAIGVGPEARVDGGCVLGAMPYLPENLFPSNWDSDYIATPACRQTSSQVVITTRTLDLTDDTASVTLDLPTDTMLFIDSIDVVITGSDGAGGSPEITVGPDDQDPADYLAATGVGKTSVGGRETHDPLVSDGVTSVRVATSTAGSGTTYEAKIVLRGYVMEL